MGDTGSLALGGALAAMAGCTGMFFPLFISSGIFVLETLSVVMQVSTDYNFNMFSFSLLLIVESFFHLLYICSVLSISLPMAVFIITYFVCTLQYAVCTCFILWSITNIFVPFCHYSYFLLSLPQINCRVDLFLWSKVKLTNFWLIIKNNYFIVLKNWKIYSKVDYIYFLTT